MENNKGTICVQGGWKPTKGEPRVLPIYQSTTFISSLMKTLLLFAHRQKHSGERKS